VIHTFCVHGIVRSISLAAVLGVFGATSATGAAVPWKAAVDEAARTSPEARILILDLATGRLIAAHKLSEAAHTLAEPGSTLKPLVLYELIANGRWNPERRIACNRALMIAGRRLACAHPTGPPFDAQEALAWSCNSYFAEVARSLAPGELGRFLRPSGLLAVSGLASPVEAAAEFREPTDAATTQLALLGVGGIRITPLELAVAYRWLARQFGEHTEFQSLARSR
jgi:cell division protein FtsI/penicillin-binding protein 2